MTLTASAVGAAAPDFTLKDQNGQDVLAGVSSVAPRTSSLVFYPFAFSGICTGELCEIRDDLGGFVGDDVQVLARLLRPHVQPARLGRQGGLLLPPAVRLLAARRGRAVRTACSNEQAGAALRGTFLIDTEGIVRWSLVNEIGTGPRLHRLPRRAGRAARLTGRALR